MYPISSPFHDGNSVRALAIGGPFFLLTAIGLVYPLRHRYVNGLRAGVVVSFVLWFVPLELDRIRGRNYVSAAPFTIFAIFLAGLTLQALWSAIRLAARARGGGGASRSWCSWPATTRSTAMVCERRGGTSGEPDQPLAEAGARRTSRSTGTSSDSRESARRGCTSRPAPTSGSFERRRTTSSRAGRCTGSGGERPVQRRGHARDRRRRGSISGARSGVMPVSRGSARTLDALNVGYVLGNAGRPRCALFDPDHDVSPRPPEGDDRRLPKPGASPTPSLSRPRRAGSDLAPPYGLLDAGASVRRLRPGGTPARAAGRAGRALERTDLSVQLAPAAAAGADALPALPPRVASAAVGRQYRRGLQALRGLHRLRPPPASTRRGSASSRPLGSCSPVLPGPRSSSGRSRSPASRSRGVDGAKGSRRLAACRRTRSSSPRTTRKAWSRSSSRASARSWTRSTATPRRSSSTTAARDRTYELMLRRRAARPALQARQAVAELRPPDRAHRRRRLARRATR